MTYDMTMKRKKKMRKNKTSLKNHQKSTLRPNQQGVLHQYYLERYLIHYCNVNKEI